MMGKLKVTEFLEAVVIGAGVTTVIWDINNLASSLALIIGW